MTVRVTFNNQERIENLAGRVAQQITPDSVSLLKAFESQVLAANGFLKKMHWECIYQIVMIFWNTTAENFDTKCKKCTKVLVKQKNEATELGLQPGCDKPYHCPEETKKIDERKRVAGVYINRLKRKMMLQADPTVIYAMKLELHNGYNQTCSI